jgi:predicted DNA-binding protein (MmcQ/YjbR family)
MATRRTAGNGKRPLERACRPLTAQDAGRRNKLLELVESLPESRIATYGQRHLGMKIGAKTFAYYLNQHHDDGIIAVCCKSTPARQRELIGRDPQRFLVPAYLGKDGWVSLRLDLKDIDWDEVLHLLVQAYRAQAPRRLLRDME